MKPTSPFTALVAVVALSLSSLVSAQSQPDPDLFTPSMRSIKLIVDDFEKTTAFYKVLGMKEGANHGAVAELVWESKTNNSGIVMVSQDYPGREGMIKGGTYLMIMTTDVQAVVDNLRNAGFSGVSEPRTIGNRVAVAMLRDPDGNQIELMGPLPQ